MWTSVSNVAKKKQAVFLAVHLVHELAGKQHLCPGALCSQCCCACAAWLWISMDRFLRETWDGRRVDDVQIRKTVFSRWTEFTNMPCESLWNLKGNGKSNGLNLAHGRVLTFNDPTEVALITGFLGIEWCRDGCSVQKDVELQFQCLQLATICYNLLLVPTSNILQFVSFSLSILLMPFKLRY